MRPARALALLLLAAGCGEEELLHGLAEPQANEALVALEEGGVRGEKRRADGTDGGWVLAVPGGDAAAARRILTERSLPRAPTAGFGDVFGEAGMVPTPIEEHARYLHALSGELSRSLASIDGILEARVHLGLPQEDPLRTEGRRTPRAAVLLRCRPASCAAVRALEPGLRALVAGAADGLAPEAVSLLVAEAQEVSARDRVRSPAPPWRRVLGVALAVLAVGLALFALRRWLPLRLGRQAPPKGP